jgi:CubicO group peptidase (beta-lactamase class C family)
LFLLPAAFAICYDPSPAFPVPQWLNGAETLGPALSTIKSKLDSLIADPKYDASSFSVEITSGSESLWSHFHTARKQNESRPGDKVVDGDSLYRIASITKTFTVLGLLYQHDEGNLNLDTAISEYIPELAGSDSGDIPWKDITLRSLASQLSGIPRDFAQSDVALGVPDPTELGLPPVTEKERQAFPACDQYADYEPPCNASDLIDWLKRTGKPVFAPNQESTYSNIAFELIGIALERATNKTYKDYMQQAIFDPLDMSLTSIDTPSDDHAVLPIGDNYWGIDEGVQNPTGGIYSSSNDMSKYLRYILTHFNAIAKGVNWLFPASWGGGATSFYGMPWETFRPDNVLEQSRRPVTFVTKGGGLPGYATKISILPEYGLGVTILLSCAWDCGNLLGAMQEAATVDLVRGAENVIWAEVHRSYTGQYLAVDDKLNSSLELESSPTTGLVSIQFISNGTDVLNTVVPKYYVDNTRPWRLQLIPTLLYKDEKQQRGEIWRLTPQYARQEGIDRGVWDEFCTTDVDGAVFAAKPMTEIVFWHEDGIVEMPAWKLKMKRASVPKDDAANPIAHNELKV